jgi:hypothetical protein
MLPGQRHRDNRAPAGTPPEGKAAEEAVDITF